MGSSTVFKVGLVKPRENVNFDPQNFARAPTEVMMSAGTVNQARISQMFLLVFIPLYSNDAEILCFGCKFARTCTGSTVVIHT